ncbi:hypothetical protein NEHOM01_2193 [Nematocida homosporus]|uniref:uncharacterized protein n=1 Tax=Nematocida homosporus TaxID=1912981 RepID=UPI00221F42C4|nr:uncharacterized protein NEHOM01_2193 [Nematocida homosporus]KAI5187457.1 hypothetical protein NEHOM01_2193 [Nematocida homosporus]
MPRQGRHGGFSGLIGNPKNQGSFSLVRENCHIFRSLQLMPMNISDPKSLHWGGPIYYLLLNLAQATSLFTLVGFLESLTRSSARLILTTSNIFGVLGTILAFVVMAYFYQRVFKTSALQASYVLMYSTVHVMPCMWIYNMVSLLITILFALSGADSHSGGGMFLVVVICSMFAGYLSHVNFGSITEPATTERDMFIRNVVLALGGLVVILAMLSFVYGLPAPIWVIYQSKP